MELEKLPNKRFAYECVKLLIDNDVLGDSELNVLTNGEKCARLFCCSSGFPILLEVSKYADEEELSVACYDGTKRQRYYKDIITHNGKAYVVTNHWYGPNKTMPDNRTPFMKWVLAKI